MSYKSTYKTKMKLIMSKQSISMYFKCEKRN